MSKLKTLMETSNLKSVDDIIRYISIIKDEYNRLLNGTIDFDDNIRTSTVSVSFTTANKQIQVPHTLGRTPIGYIQAKSNVATNIYDGISSNTASFLYVKSSAIANVTLVVF